MSLSACGFHPHNRAMNGEQTQKVVLFSNDPYGPFVRQVRRELKLAGITIVDYSEDQSVMTLTLDNVNMTKGNLAVGIDGFATIQQLSGDINITLNQSGQENKHFELFEYVTDNLSNVNRLGNSSRQELNEELLYSKLARKIAIKVSQNGHH